MMKYDICNNANFGINKLESFQPLSVSQVFQNFSMLLIIWNKISSYTQIMHQNHVQDLFPFWFWPLFEFWSFGILASFEFWSFTILSIFKPLNFGLFEFWPDLNCGLLPFWPDLLFYYLLCWKQIILSAAFKDRWGDKHKGQTKLKWGDKHNKHTKHVWTCLDKFGQVWTCLDKLKIIKIINMESSTTLSSLL